MIRLPERRPRAVVFDMDGLMFDSERVSREHWQAVARERGLTMPDAVFGSLIGRNHADSDRLLRAHFGAAFALDEFRAAVEARKRQHIEAEGLPHKPGLFELLDFLEERAIPKAVATSTAGAKARVTLGPLVGRFHALAFGDEVTRGKPAPDLYLLAAERLGVEPADCVALEDSPPGHAAAEAAGMAAVLIPDLIVPATLPRYCCHTLADVTEWLRLDHALG